MPSSPRCLSRMRPLVPPARSFNTYSGAIVHLPPPLRDLGGTATTADVTHAVCRLLRAG